MDLPLYLKNRMAKRQLSHAYLVVGENRRELAQTLAAAWVCTGDKPPCGQCSGCRKAAAGIHPDIIRADPDGDGLKAEAVRALRSDAYIRPNEAPKKVYVLEHAELLNATGQNILLKLIEGAGVRLLPLPLPQPGAAAGDDPLPLRDPPGPRRRDGAGQPGRPDLGRPHFDRRRTDGEPALPHVIGEEGPAGDCAAAPGGERKLGGGAAPAPGSVAGH